MSSVEDTNAPKRTRVRAADKTPAELASSPRPSSDIFSVGPSIAETPFDLDASLDHLAQLAFVRSPAYDGTVSNVRDFRKKEKGFPDTRPYVTLLGDDKVPLPWAYQQTAVGLDELHEVSALSSFTRVAC